MIELNVDAFIDGNVIFHIVRQDEEDYKRLKEGEITFEINGIDYIISTASFPEFYFERKQFYVRGRNKANDFDQIEVSLSEYLNIYELVKKYNEYLHDF